METKDAPLEAPPLYHRHWNFVEFIEYQNIIQLALALLCQVRWLVFPWLPMRVYKFARLEEKIPFFTIPDSFWLVRNVSQECFEVGDASGATMSQRPYNHGFLSMSSFCTRILFMEGHAFLQHPSWPHLRQIS